MNTKNNSITQFTDKYTKTGIAGNFLVKNFFRTLKTLAPTNVKNVLEVGCGAGYSLMHLRKFLGEEKKYSACDIDPELVILAKKKNPNADCVTASIYTLPYPDHSFDLIVCLEVLEHLDNPKLALAEIARVAKNHIIISTPREPIWRCMNFLRFKYWKGLGNTPGHINHWSSKTLAKLARNYFDIIKIRKPFPWTMIYGKVKNEH